MSRFVPLETDPIDLGEGDVVHIRRRMSYGQQRALASLFTGTEASAGLREYLAALLEQNIVRWDGPGFVDVDGNPMPITRDSIDALDSSVADLLVEEIGQRNPNESARPLIGTASAGSSPTRSSTAARSPASTSSSGSPDGSAGPGTS